jgi:hypothetical protein
VSARNHPLAIEARAVRIYFAEITSLSLLSLAAILRQP